MKISSSESTVYRELLSEIMCEAIQLMSEIRTVANAIQSWFQPVTEAHSYAALREAANLADVCDATRHGSFR